jgi:CoA-transferase family III
VRPAAECLAQMKALDVVASRIYTVADIIADANYREREDIITTADADLGDIRMQNVLPKFSFSPGALFADRADGDLPPHDVSVVEGSRRAPAVGDRGISRLDVPDKRCADEAEPVDLVQLPDGSPGQVSPLP